MKRIVIYSPDGIGLGHLQRCSLISKKLASAKNIEILIIGSSPYDNFIPYGPGVDFIKLPSVLRISKHTWLPRYIKTSTSSIMSLRKEIVNSTLRKFRPDLLLVDHLPLGVNFELTESLEYLSKNNIPVVFGIRDILGNPEIIKDIWGKYEYYDAIDKYYSQTIIYGTSNIYSTATKYNIPEPYSYSGYIVGDNFKKVTKLQNGEVEIVITVGGGWDAYIILLFVIEALQIVTDTYQKVKVSIITGPLMQDAEIKKLSYSIKNSNWTLYQSLPSLDNVIRRATIVIAMAGYNTVSEVLAQQRQLICIPRDSVSQEQKIRANVLSKKKFLLCQDIKDNCTSSLVNKIIKLINQNGNLKYPTQFEGLDNTCKVILSYL